MKIITILANLAFLGFIVYMTFDAPPSHSKDYFIISAIAFLPLLNIFTLARSNISTNGESLFPLFVERIKLEQKKKINELKGNSIQNKGNNT